MRVLVTGANGMLGTDVCAALEAAGHVPVATDVTGDMHRMDITDPHGVANAIECHLPDAVIHCAAYTNVDQAEREPDAAYRLNALGSWTVAAACAARDIPLCAISTDFVFDGTKKGPYTEFDAPNPISHYGASKLAGETCVRQLCRRHWIVRTAWLFGVNGKSFPDSILNAAARIRREGGGPLRVVADQRGSPTLTADLAEALVGILANPLYGTYHVTNRGETTWHGFACRALDIAGLNDVEVQPIPSSEWPSPVKRPANSVLRPLALEMQGAYPMRPWEDALADFVRRRSEKAAALANT